MQSSAGHEIFQLAPHSKRPSERPQGQDCTVRHTLPKGRAINETRPLLQKFFAALTAVPAAGPKTALSPPHAVAEECTMPPRHSTPDVLPKHRQGSTKSPQFPNATPTSPNDPICQTALPMASRQTYGDRLAGQGQTLSFCVPKRPLERARCVRFRRRLRTTCNLGQLLAQDQPLNLDPPDTQR